MPQVSRCTWLTSLASRLSGVTVQCLEPQELDIEIWRENSCDHKVFLFSDSVYDVENSNTYPALQEIFFLPGPLWGFLLLLLFCLVLFLVIPEICQVICRCAISVN